MAAHVQVSIEPNAQEPRTLVLEPRDADDVSDDQLIEWVAGYLRHFFAWNRALRPCRVEIELRSREDV